MEIATRRREQEVWQACDDLWASHGEMRSLTGDSIRERLMALGKSKGSPNEIYRYRKTWALSRNIHDAPNEQNWSETDPISRAVRVVHENLKIEANERAEQMKAEFFSQLQEKDQEISKSKHVIDTMVNEFSETQREVLSLKNQLKTLNEQWHAEIDVRKAIEKELSLTKTVREQEQRRYETMIADFKIVFDQQLAQTKQQYQEITNKAEIKIDKLSEENARIGQEFSDQLNELKVALYNHEWAKKNLEKKQATLLHELNEATASFSVKTKEIELLTHEKADMEKQLDSLKAHFQIISIEQLERKSEIKSLRIACKKAESTVTRLRAQIRPIVS